MSETTWQRCEICDFIGPDPSPLNADWRDFHRATHNVCRLITETLRIPGMTKWLARAADFEAKR